MNKYNSDDGITLEIIVNILQDLGPTFVKLGQIASQLSDYMPTEFCEALAKLRSNVAPMYLETVHAQIEKYPGKPVNELFASFDEGANYLDPQNGQPLHSIYGPGTHHRCTDYRFHPAVHDEFHRRGQRHWRNGLP